MKSYKKKIVFRLTLLFALTMLFPVFEAQIVEKSVIPENNISNNEFTHNVFGEEATATWCPNCPKANAHMYEVYNMGYDFDFVSLVSDMNSYAASRISELGFNGVPSIAFDGGNKTYIGAQKDNVPYKNAVIECSSRTIADIELDLDAFWMGDGQIQVYVHITNNEVDTYSGHLHVYVTEITSRWNDKDGNPYHFAMIGNYPINKNVNIEAGKIETYFKEWNSPYKDITMDNIKIIASVFDISTKYTDKTTTVDPKLPNTDPPSIPSKPTGPSSGNISSSYTFSTSSTEPNGDLIQYGWDWNGDNNVEDWTDLYLSGQTIQSTYKWGSTGTYSIKVKAKDQFGTESGWSNPLEIKMPKNKMYYNVNILFERLFQRFPIFEKILNKYYN